MGPRSQRQSAIFIALYYCTCYDVDGWCGLDHLIAQCLQIFTFKVTLFPFPFYEQPTLRTWEFMLHFIEGGVSTSLMKYFCVGDLSLLHLFTHSVFTSVWTQGYIFWGQSSMGLFNLLLNFFPLLPIDNSFNWFPLDMSRSTWIFSFFFF